MRKITAPKIIAAATLLIMVLFGQAISAERVVLAEEFTGTWCGWCPTAMEGLYILEQLVGAKLAVIAYHISDSFTVPGCTTRRAYYGVSAYPTVWFDGLIQRVGGDTIPVDYTPQYNQREGIPSPVTIDLTLLEYDGATGMGSVRAVLYNETANSISAQLRYVAVGDDIEYNWAGFDHLYFTALHIFPSAAGVAINIGPGEFLEDEQDFLLPEDWRDEDCTVVAFLQDDTTKEVLQAGQLSQITPVELVNFTAAATPDGVLLSWITASEKENAGFRMYRIHNGNEEVLTDGLIPGAGSSAMTHRYEFVDSEISPGATYIYRLSDISLSGFERFHEPVTCTVPTEWGVVSSLQLNGISPSPTTDVASLNFSLPAASEVMVAIYDVSGHEVRVISPVWMDAGAQNAVWDLTDDHGSRVSPGLYIASIKTLSERVSTKIVVTE